MFDARLRPIIDPHVNRIARLLFKRGIRANQLTFAGLIVALLTTIALASGWFFTAVLLIILNRGLDGVDGPLSRLYHPDQNASEHDFGGFFDIVADFVFYGGVPLGFALYDPVHNGAAASFLLFSFILCCATFLAFATMAAKRGLSTTAQGKKSFYYLEGLMEGSETIFFFILMCLFASFFDALAIIFGILCCISAGVRVINARALLR